MVHYQHHFWLQYFFNFTNALSVQTQRFTRLWWQQLLSLSNNCYHHCACCKGMNYAFSFFIETICMHYKLAIRYSSPLSSFTYLKKTELRSKFEIILKRKLIILIPVYFLCLQDSPVSLHEILVNKHWYVMMWLMVLFLEKNKNEKCNDSDIAVGLSNQ